MVITKIETITPAMAMELLKKNHNNRPIQRRSVERFKQALTKGTYQLNGDTIRVDEDGNVLDGQNRLTACVECGVSFTTLVCRGLPRSVFSTIDVGVSRTLAHHLETAGIDDASTASKIIRLSVNLDQENPLSIYDMTGDQAVAWAKCRREELKDAVAAGRRLHGDCKFLSPASWATMWMKLRSIEKDRAGHFLDQVATGAGLESGSIRLVLRRALESVYSKLGGQRDSMEKMAMVIKAWNHDREGTTVDRIRFQSRGVRAEKYPRPR